MKSTKQTGFNAYWEKKYGKAENARKSRLETLNQTNPDDDFIEKLLKDYENGY